jgi:hypothetical protein
LCGINAPQTDHGVSVFYNFAKICKSMQKGYSLS